MTEQEYDKEILKRTVDAINTAYEKGYDSACENIIAALGLVPVVTMQKDHIIKLINIVQKVSKQNK